MDDRPTNDAVIAHRTEIIERALRVLPASFPFAGLSDREIALATIDALHRKRDTRSLIVQGFDIAMLADKCDDYVFGIFDGATDSLARHGLSRRPTTNAGELS